MGRSAAGKLKTTKFVFLLVGLLGLFLIIDLLWASSSSSPSNWALRNSDNIVVQRPVHANSTTPDTSHKVSEFLNRHSLALGLMSFHFFLSVFNSHC